MSVCLCVCLSVCVFVCMFACLSVCSVLFVVCLWFVAGCELFVMRCSL